ncbi:DUF2513 domain-containing protein [Companilactobacillus halodurans]|uniref:DUF2513 domain-containing protein n=1 Tax=Companilactobacillus halodurans TaxID=2584183 RepID=A0A5P0ZYQ6_9LACO|nr:DUF2513 domain-containing protein [Companilactobacillus halodurans]MQS75019.1 DUF2513 domain-containing protein [Companilactobacillus halodurans]MQS97874.1 DUF2513 domain-containing protein [Companilactobacillus halodurans]
MRLNNECIRNSLLEIESKLEFDENLESEELLKFETCKKFGNEEFLYTLSKLNEAGFIVFNTTKADNNSYYWFNVSEITWNGHQYLDNVRDPIVWKETKKVLKNFESVSISFVSNVAAEILSNLIKQYMN